MKDEIEFQFAVRACKGAIPIEEMKNKNWIIRKDRGTTVIGTKIVFRQL